MSPLRALPLALLLVLCLPAVLVSQHQVGPRSGDPAAGEPAADRVREGTELVEALGNFEVTGDRATFFDRTTNRRFRVLENLALERVIRVVDDRPGRLAWRVTGVVTEFQGANFLLVTHAVANTEAQTQ